MLTDDELRSLAGEQAFKRGASYCRAGRITLSRHGDDGLDGEAEGSETYSLWIRRDGARWRWACSCPAADDGDFCKHLVAAALTARGESENTADERDDEAPAKHRASAPAAKPTDDLASFLRAQSAERLSDWLLAIAREDSSVEKRLRLYRAGDDPEALKAALGKMLDAGGMLDYRGSIDYARRLEAVIVQLDAAIARDADSGRLLCEYVLNRLRKIYERSDDSAGSIGNQLRAVAERHARACVAAAPGKALVKTLLALQQKDDWDLFPIAAYWAALGPEGQADYGKRIGAEFAKLEGAGAGTSDFGVEQRAEEFARATGDFEFLQRVLRRHLSAPHHFLHVLESLREFNRQREALDWAEQAVRRFPGDDRLRAAFAECLASSGLDAEATEQAWQAFRLSPDTESWDLLKRYAGPRWSAMRVRALADVAAQEEGDASLRVILLDHDGDFDAAVALAHEGVVGMDVAQKLAHRLQRDRPALAGEFYLRIASALSDRLVPRDYAALAQTLKRVAQCLPADQWKPVLAQIRAEHGRKPKLMGLLAAAGL